jgi:hypothetical protein
VAPSDAATVLIDGSDVGSSAALCEPQLARPAFQPLEAPLLLAAQGNCGRAIGMIYRFDSDRSEGALPALADLEVAHLPKRPDLLRLSQGIPVGLRLALSLGTALGLLRRQRRQSTRDEMAHFSAFRALKNGLIEPCARHDSNVRPLPPTALGRTRRTPYEPTLARPPRKSSRRHPDPRRAGRASPLRTQGSPLSAVRSARGRNRTPRFPPPLRPPCVKTADFGGRRRTERGSREPLTNACETAQPWGFRLG